MFAHPHSIRKSQNWALKINSLLKIHTSVRVHSHPLSPSVHCNCELSSRSEPESSDTGSKPLANPPPPQTRDFQPLSFPREGAWRQEWRQGPAPKPPSAEQRWMMAQMVQCTAAQL